MVEFPRSREFLGSFVDELSKLSMLQPRPMGARASNVGVGKSMKPQSYSTPTGAPAPTSTFQAGSPNPPPTATS